MHIRDMQALSRTHPDILRNFVEGKFVIHSSEKIFLPYLLIKLTNKTANISRAMEGIIGLTANESALSRWIVSGPQIAEMIHQFRESS